MKRIEDFKNEKIEFHKLNSYFGGTGCCEEVATEQGCGDTKKTWYNEDGSICCTETQDICCYT